MYSNNIIIQELNIIDGSDNMKLMKFPSCLPEIDIIYFQKILIFNIIKGRRYSHTFNNYVAKNKKNYEIDNYNIGNENTTTWLFSLEECDNIEINQEIKNNIISSE